MNNTPIGKNKSIIMIDVGTLSKTEIPTRPKNTIGYRMSKTITNLTLPCIQKRKNTQNGYKKLIAHLVKNKVSTHSKYPTSCRLYFLFMIQ